jgi:hypothetical protein
MKKNTFLSIFGVVLMFALLFTQCKHHKKEINHTGVKTYETGPLQGRRRLAFWYQMDSMMYINFRVE